MSSLAWLMAACAYLAADPQEMIVQNQFSQYADAGGKGVNVELRQLTGWETIRGFSWRIEQEDAVKPGTFTPADPRRIFRHGQNFRIRIDSYCDQYVYVLVRNADGTEEVLLPKGAEAVPRIAKGATLFLPPDNTAFIFTPPAGKEELRVIVSPIELPWATSREWFKLQNGQRLDARETEKPGPFEAARPRSADRALDRPRTLPQVKSLAQAAKDIAAGKMARGCEVVATEPTAEGNLVLVASSRRDCKAVLVCDIVLKHEK